MTNIFDCMCNTGSVTDMLGTYVVHTGSVCTNGYIFGITILFYFNLFYPSDCSQSCRSGSLNPHCYSLSVVSVGLMLSRPILRGICQKWWIRRCGLYEVRVRLEIFLGLWYILPAPRLLSFCKQVCCRCHSFQEECSDQYSGPGPLRENQSYYCCRYNNLL